MMWNMRFINYRENKLIVTKYVQYVGHWQEHKHASMSAIGQLCHQSATASSRATHAVNGYLLKFMWRPVYVTNKIPYSLPSVEPGAHPGVRAVWLFKSSPAAGCHYFPPDLRSPSQPKNVTVLQPVLSYTAWWQRHIGVNNLLKVFTQLCLDENRTHDLMIASPTLYSHCVTYLFPLKVIKIYQDLSQMYCHLFYESECTRDQMVIEQQRTVTYWLETFFVLSYIVWIVLHCV